MKITIETKCNAECLPLPPWCGRISIPAAGPSAPRTVRTDGDGTRYRYSDAGELEVLS